MGLLRRFPPLVLGSLLVFSSCSEGGSSSDPLPRETSETERLSAGEHFDDCWEIQYHTAENAITEGDTALFGLRFGQHYDQAKVLDSLGALGILRRDKLRSWVYYVDLGPTAIPMQPYLIQKDSIGLYAITLKVNDIDLPPLGGIPPASRYIAQSLYQKWGLGAGGWRPCLSDRAVDFYWFRGPVELSMKVGEKHVEVNCVHVPSQQ